jgi:hypothetical protein
VRIVTKTDRHRVSIFTHRWMALVIGVLLTAEVANGALLLHRPDIYSLQHQSITAAGHERVGKV